MLILRAVFHSGTIVEQEQDSFYADDDVKNFAMMKFLSTVMENVTDDFIEEIDWLAY